MTMVPTFCSAAMLLSYITILILVVDGGVQDKASDVLDRVHDQCHLNQRFVISHRDYYARCMSESKDEGGFGLTEYRLERYNPERMSEMSSKPEPKGYLISEKCCNLRYCKTVVKSAAIPEDIQDVFRAWQNRRPITITCPNMDKALKGFDKEKMEKLDKIDDECRGRMKDKMEDSENRNAQETCAKEAGLKTPLNYSADLRAIPHQAACCMVRRCLNGWDNEELGMKDIDFPVKLPKDTQDLINKKWETLKPGETYDCDVTKPLPNPNGAGGKRGDGKAMGFLLMGFIWCALVMI